MLSNSDHNGLSVPVHSLIGKKGISFYLTCLYSLQFFSADPVHFVIHSDGSLDDEDYSVIRKRLGADTVFISREDANEKVCELLEKYPNCLRLRKDSIWGIEMFDYHLLEPDSLSFWCDADVRFFRPYSGLFTRRTAQDNCVFIKDTAWHAYTFLPNHLFGKNALKVCAGINTGMNILDKKYYDLEFVDWFLGKNEFFRIPEWVVPSCYAALGGRCRSSFVKPQQLLNLYPNARISGETFAGHFLSSYRNERMPLFEEDWEGRNREAYPIQAEIIPCRYLGPIEYAGNLIKRKIANRFGLYF
jgi:hypothetical protein